MRGRVFRAGLRAAAAAAVAMMAMGGSLVVAPAATAASSGVNDPGCRPAPGREPVIMLHGLTANGGLNFFTKAPLIAAAGFCVYTPTYGVRFGFGGFNSMRDSAAEVGDYVDEVLAQTGAAKVNLVGHSEGTTVSAYYLKFLGGNAKVSNFVGFGSNFKGTTLYGLNVLVRSIPGLANPVLQGICPACDEFLTPSTFLDDLNRGGVTAPGTRYTSIVSRYDEVVVPYTSGILNEPGVTNVVLQDGCVDLAGHLAQAVDPNVTRTIIWALKGQVGPRPGCIPFFIPG